MSSCASRRTSALTQLKRDNRDLLLRLVITHGGLTQSQLAQTSGLSKAAVSNLVRGLVDDGQVVVESTVQGGRRAKLVKPARQQGLTVGLDIVENYVGIALVSADHAELCAVQLPVEADDRSADVEARLLVRLEALLAQVGRTKADILGIGVGLPAPIDIHSNRVSIESFLPSWFDDRGIVELHRLTEGPVLLGNDANFAALSEVTFGEHRGADNLVYIMVSRGIGLGMILNGSEYVGALGFAGELGHVRSGMNTEICRCGNRGCLEMEISTAAIVRQSNSVGYQCDSISDVMEAVEAGHMPVCRVVDEAGRTLGRVLSDLTSVLNPGVIVVGGNSIATSPVFMDAANATLRRYCLPNVADSITIHADSLAGKAVALGAAEHVLRSLSL